jgi:hypothetical protein
MKEKITYTLLSLVVMIVVSCSHSEKSDENEREYYPRTTFTLEDSVRTLNLSYIMWACECPNWAITENLYQYQENGTLGMECFYIEPASDDLTLPDTIGYNDQVLFTGQFYNEKGYPKNYPKTEQDADESKVFRYTAYKIIKSNHRRILNEIEEGKNK